MQGKTLIKSRAIVPIFYSSVTNTSKKISFMFQQRLQSENFLSTVTNIGDIDKQELFEHTGPLVMILSTYGNGGSPADGEEFVEWLRGLEKKDYFGSIELCILGLGNRSFEHFCGNSRTIRQLMVHNGAKEVIELVTCNSAASEENAYAKFQEWSNSFISKLKQKYQIKQINAQQLLQKYKAIPNSFILSDTDWQKDQALWQPRLGKQFLSYHKSYKSQVIHIKELRQHDDLRSTLWIRLKVPEGMHLEPACNVSVYPENVRKGGEDGFKGSFTIQAVKKNAKVPYPPMSMEGLWRISNFAQIADLNIIKYALTMSQQSAQVKSKYQIYLKNPEELEKTPIRCYQLYEDLKPGLDFMVKIGINSVRPYTLASWQPKKGYFDLVVAIDPLGLTSRYFQSHPKQIRILPTHSSFYVPSGRPVVMIANGSGIAPFRSLTQHFLNHHQQIPALFLYYGIQNKDVDFYFRNQWQEMQKNGKIKLRIAQSRAGENKCYVQALVKQDKQFFAEHLFKNKGVIFICGSAGMAKSVDTEIFEAIKVHQPIPFKAFKLSTELVKNKTVVKEVFD